MAKFIYQMQGLLNIKQKLEEQEKTAYSLTKIKYNEEEEKLKKLYEKKDYYLECKKEKMSDRLKVNELALLENAIYSTKLLIEEQLLAVKRAEQALQTATIRLENAMKERKTQEKLREKAWEQFQKEQEAEEQKEINEVVTFRHRKQEESI